jgi:protein disulfide-isomerase A1
LFALVFACAVADVEEPDVVVLTTDNFAEFLKNDFVLVEFYAPWCGHCKKLAPEYSQAATELKNSGSPVKLGKVDATVESSLGEQFAVRGYPTLKFFRSGEAAEYDGGRTAKDIVNWVTKKSGPPSKTLTSKADIDAVVAGSGTRLLGYVSGANEATWLNIAKSEKASAFAFSHVNDHAHYNGKSEGTVELHKDGEDVKTFDGELSEEAVIQWVLAEGYPLVDELAQESWTRAQTSGLDLLAVFLNKGDTKAAEAALAVAKKTKGTLVVTSSDQVGIASRWGASGNVVPTVIYVVNNGGSPSFVIWNEETNAELNAESLQAFVDGSKDGSYDSYIKSEPIPEDNNGPVTVLVGKNFDAIVNQKKDVLVEFYAPWCGHCQKLAPIYDELGAAFKDDDNVVIAKMDATANGLPKGVSVQGFPTIIFFDANGEKQTYEGERELDGFKSWIDSHRVSKPSAEKEDL